MAAALKPTLADKAAVLQGLPEHPAVKAILACNADALLDAKFDFSELTLTIAPEQIRAALATVQAAGYNVFEDMTAVDWYPDCATLSVELPHPVAPNSGSGSGCA